MNLFKTIKSLTGRCDDTSGDLASAEVSAPDAAFSTNGNGAMQEHATSGHPYLQGRYEFERFFGDLARRRRTWQVVAIMALIVNLVLVVGYVELARRQKVVPYVVELDALGESRSVGKLALDEVPERAVIAALRRFIHNARTIPTDARLLNARLNEARAFALGQALTSFMQAVRGESQVLEQMLQRGDARYVEEISNILPVPNSPNSYRVTWREWTDSKEGNTNSAYEGYFTMHIAPPETEEEILANPFGIFVVDYTWSRLNSLSVPEE